MLPRDKEPALRHLVEVFLAENAKLNLSSLRTPDAAWTGHILDSIALLEILPFLEEKIRTQKLNRLLDIGTGGGFPLLPLAIALPETQCHGLDATGKKIFAVKRMLKEIHLSNVSRHTGRCEELAHDPELRATFDVVTARAVCGIAELLEYAIPFLRPHGCLVLWKSLSAGEEITQSAHAQKVLLAPLIHHHRYELPEPFGVRQLLVFQKEHPTDPRYPRPVGVPKKSPL